MIDYMNKVVTILLIFCLLVVGPSMISYQESEMLSNSQLLNEVNEFIDKVTDKSSILEADLDDLYLGVNSCGNSYVVNVERYIRAATEDDKGEIRTLYFSNDDLEVLNVGDVVKVSIKEVSLSPAKRMLWSVLRIDRGKTEFSLAGSVR